MSIRRIRIRVGYDGTNYAGWQRQNNGIAVQACIEEALKKLFGQEIKISGSGRTDAGVHARGQIAAFDLDHPIPTDRLLLALNSNLPDDIRIYEVAECELEFHPQFDAKKKTYRYRFYEGLVMPPEYHRFAVQVLPSVDWTAGEKALSLIEGEHDFAAFCASGSTVTSTVRTIYQAKMIRENDFITLEVSGNGFLYNMVRIIAGVVLDIAKGKLTEEDLKMALEKRDRTLLGATAPAKGLMLWSVEYPIKNS